MLATKLASKSTAIRATRQAGPADAEGACGADEPCEGGTAGAGWGAMAADVPAPARAATAGAMPPVDDASSAAAAAAAAISPLPVRRSGMLAGGRAGGRARAKGPWLALVGGALCHAQAPRAHVDACARTVGISASPLHWPRMQKKVSKSQKASCLRVRY